MVLTSGEFLSATNRLMYFNFVQRLVYDDALRLAVPGNTVGAFISITKLSGFQFRLLGPLNGSRRSVPRFRSMLPDMTGSPRGRDQQRHKRNEKDDKEPAHEDEPTQGYQRAVLRL